MELELNSFMEPLVSVGVGWRLNGPDQCVVRQIDP